MPHGPRFIFRLPEEKNRLPTDLMDKPHKTEKRLPVQGAMAGVASVLGNQAFMHRIGRGATQTYTKVSQLDGAGERRAGRIAATVMRKGAQPAEMTDQAPTPGNVGRDPRALGSGRPLMAELRQFFEPRFGQNLGHVRIHTDDKTAGLAAAIHARAFAIGTHIGFGRGTYNPESQQGRTLLAHELAHCVTPCARHEAGTIWRDGLRIRSPVLDETLMQYTTAWQAGRGRPLSSEEIALARTVFGDSLDYDRIRFIPSEGRGLDWRTVGNTIREPPGFTITDAYMAHTFIHELTHIWQYQQYGSAYISRSLFENLGGIIATGHRGAAYVYHIEPGRRFFEYDVEQQASIVQDYFIAVRDSVDTTLSPERRTSAARRRDERQPLIDQMRAALPRREVDLMLIRAQDIIGGPPSAVMPEPPAERRILPVRPLISIEW